jgi:hypothetical protein
MSTPPKYQQVADDESQSLLKGPYGPDSHVIDVSHTYPPGGVSGSGPQTTTMAYTFHPRYPIKGNDEHYFGLLGRSKEVSCVVWVFLVSSVSR